MARAEAVVEERVVEPFSGAVMAASPFPAINLRVQAARQADLELVRSWVLSNPEAWADWTGSDFTPEQPVEELWEGVKLAPGATTLLRFVACNVDGLAVGYLEAHVGDVPNRAAMLVRLIVSPAYRRRGVATRLVGEAMDELRRSGIQRVSLLVACGNSAALAFYASLGFQGSLGLESNRFYLLVANEWKYNA